MAHHSRLSVAPMLDWTDQHCRYFHRLLCKNSLLYTEMVTTGALLYGDVARHLSFNEQEHPLALQLGGSDPTDLAKCAKLAQDWGYEQVNLNCGCPSERVQKGAFGACLMAEPVLVADCVKAMRDACDLPITVKHRIGINKIDSYDFLSEFVNHIQQAGCETIIVHARSAWLKGLSPKENREIPPLQPQMVEQLKRDFPDLTVIINGGIQNNIEIAQHLEQLDGVMVGRKAYHDPWIMSDWDALFFDSTPSTSPVSRDVIEMQMVEYMMTQQHKFQTPWTHIAKHMLGLRNGLPGARIWRQVWSNHQNKLKSPLEVYELAHQSLVFGSEN